MGRGSSLVEFTWVVEVTRFCSNMLFVDKLAVRLFRSQSTKDFDFVLFMVVTLDFGSQIPLLGTMFHGLGTKTQGSKT